jgi:hypothetical protein
MNHFMVDLETMGLRDNSAIISIGVVQFDERLVGRLFYTNVSLSDCVAHGLVTDQSTVDWWLKQSEEARLAWQTNPTNLLDALTQFVAYLRLCTDNDMSKVRLWGNGAGFDNVLLKNAFKAVDADEPWKYYNNRCYRTMSGVFKLDDDETPPRVGTYHNALDDAMTQVHRLQAICGKYGITLN